MNDRLNDIRNRLNDVNIGQDFPWYWASFGEKCYSFATVAAFPDTDDFDQETCPPACELVPHPTKEHVWIAKDGTEMMIDGEVASSEEQCGQDVCRFIAHAREDIGWLLDELARSQAEGTTLKQQIAEALNDRNHAEAMRRDTEDLLRMANEEILDLRQQLADRSIALADLSAERARQISQEGWTPLHDDSHDKGEMANAAAGYAATTPIYCGVLTGPNRQTVGQSMLLDPQDVWPWSSRRSNGWAGRQRE